jgi:ribonuclease E
MANKMLIDATHPEETRVVVLRGNRVEEFDFESAQRKQLRGNIYLAKVTRVEPSLQAAFVDYGGNRHGFLAFSEIHPDYYQIPVADRQALIEEEERVQRAAEAEADHRSGRNGRRRGHRHRRAERSDDVIASEPIEPAETGEIDQPDEHRPEEHQPSEAERRFTTGFEPEPRSTPASATTAEMPPAPESVAQPLAESLSPPVTGIAPQEAAATAEVTPPSGEETTEAGASEPVSANTDEPVAADADEPVATHADADENGDENGEEEVVETVGEGDALEEVPERMVRPRRQYKIQEVIKRRQIMLVQVVKEERGTKGAALTTYLSLAGRYSVLMPNTARGGGISRKITSAEDRKRLKEVAEEMEVPEGMGVILRTAGANRTKTEVKRDFEYLLRLWETVRDLTLKSTAPTLVYEEGSLTKRSIRDLYSKDIEEIVVAGEDGYRDAKDFMRMLMPSHAKNVKLYKDSQPVFTRYGIESQLDAMFSPVVQLKSGGYIVLNQTEALVSIDVNSGRATREHHIEDTALKTNLEASTEIARQLRLRDLAGLIVIDFIDMEENRNNRAVERRLKECLKNDRARIQVGRISHFGLLEMSRQRIRTSVLESSTEKCPHCGGTGHVRSVASVALQLLRSIEEMLLKGATHNLIVRTRAEVALYALNHKRAHLRALEERFRITISVEADPTVAGQVPFAIDRGEQVMTLEQAKALVVQPDTVAPQLFEEEEPEEEAAIAPEEEEREETEASAENGDGRRRRRRGRRQPESEAALAAPDGNAGAQPVDEAAVADTPDEAREPMGEARDASEHDADRRRRRRGRRGGRRNRRGREGEPFAPANGEHDFTEGPEEPQPYDGREPQPYAAVEPTEAPQPDIAEATYAPRIEPPADIVMPLAPPAPEPVPAAAVTAEPPLPVPAPPPAAAAEPEPAKTEATTRRRRSTVREPAPMFGSAPFSVAPSAEHAQSAEHPPATESATIASSSNDSDEAGKPRRTGWWSRK